MRRGESTRSVWMGCVLVLLFQGSLIAARASGAAGGEEVSTLEAGGVVFEFVRIGPGRFRMGSDSADGDERPVHEVAFAYSFEIGTTEVTVRQFKAFAEVTGYQTVAEREGGAWHIPSPQTMGWVRTCNWRDPGYEQTGDHPVTCLSYLDAAAFCRWLAAQSGQPLRLPTEAEWEYACRAGMTGDYAGALQEMAWFAGTSTRRAHPVARKTPNRWGLYDMHGNACEWCEDVYRWHYRDAPRDGSASHNGEGPAVAAWRRVLRGGSWCTPAMSCRSSFRCPMPQAVRGSDTGFRLVRCSRPAVPEGRPGLVAVDTPRTIPARGAPGRSLTLRVDEVAFDFVRIDPGTFTMGSPHRYVDRYNWTYEMPAHDVTIGYEYYMGTTEVTVEQFRLFVERTGYVTDAEKQGWAFSAGGRPWHYEVLADWRYPGFIQTDREPVTHLGWYDTVAFCQWLGEQTGCTIRLPSEAEWEYACRAGTTGDYAGELGEMAWYLSNCPARTYPVAQKQPNGWGLYDMHGNVWEWVQDLWHDDANGAPTDGSAWLDTTEIAPHGITRGGSFGNPPWLCRSYIRTRTPPGHMVHYNNGFRLVCEVPAACGGPAESGGSNHDKATE